MKKTIILIILIMFPVGEALSCSAFSINKLDKVTFNKSYDWDIQHALLVTNKRNVSKTALVMGEGVPAIWDSKFGSLTFNQYGREFPLGGINEKGLAIETLWLPIVEFPNPSASDAKPLVNELQWVQYALDNYATVGEMMGKVENIKGISEKVQIAQVFGDIHHMACDATGDCASFEYIEGKLVVTNTSVLTNSSAEASFDYLGSFLGFGGSKPIPMEGYDSRDRFARLSHYVNNPKNAFEVLSSVEEVGYSKWQISYDLSNRSVEFRILDISRSDTKSVNLSEFDFSCNSVVKVYDIEKEYSGVIDDDFTNFDFSDNLKVIQKSADHHNFPEELVKAIAEYSGSTTCSNAGDGEGSP